MKKILLLLAEGFEFFEASVYIDVFGWNLIDGDGNTKLYTCALRKEINSTFNQKLIVDFLVDEIKVGDYDAIAIPGGFEEYGFYSDAFDPQFTAIIKKFYEEKKIISSICTGAFPIAKSGILNHKKGTTYNLNPVRQQMLADLGVNVINQPIVESDRITTSWNPSTALDVAFKLLTDLTGEENTASVKTKMGFLS